MGLLATTMACLAMGCPGPPAAAPTPQVSHFTLIYERSGGLKPMPQKLQIRPGRIGEVSVSRQGVDESEGAATRFKVQPKTIEGLRLALTRAHFATLPDPATEPGTCADCYSYEIGFRNRDLTFNDMTMPKSLAPVINRLEAIVEAHLPFH